MQRLQQRLALRLARRVALLGRLAVDRGLDGIELADATQRLFGDRRPGALIDLEQFTPRVRHAGDVSDARRLAALPRAERVIACIGIRVQPACIPGQVLPWSLALAVRRVAVERCRRPGAAPGPRVKSVDPEPADAGLAASRGEDAD
ncbi:MAG TPA: hypothetical protein VEY31_10800, partial [Roseococcus sp.]|nr:hypothetical protein [Roseococcus sp.]